MQIILTKPIYEDKKGIHVVFDVYGDGHEPGAEGVLLGGGNLTFHSPDTPKQIARAVWKEARAIRKQGLHSWQLHNQIALLLKAKAEGQERQ